MNENPNFEPESTRSLLKEIAELCEHASLTGAFNGGTARVLIRYNSILEHLEEVRAVPTGMFQRLPDNASYGEIGVEARMLASFIKGGKEKDKGPRADKSVLVRLAPFVKGEDLALMVRQQMAQGSAMDMDLITQLAPFLDQNMLSEILKDHLRPPTPPDPPAPPAPPAPPFRHEPPVTPYEALPPRIPVREEKLSVLIERLKDPTISHIEQAEILDRIRSLPSE